MAEEKVDRRIPNVFVSWSGLRSRAVATALRDWLGLVIQQCRPWMSSKDIDTGKRWRLEISAQLFVKVGIICLTSENLPAPWINFEAGALSKAVENDARVCPYCLDIKPAEVTGPLGDFNGVEADRAGTLRLVQSVNAAMVDPVDDGSLEIIFSALWPKLEAELAKIPKSPTPSAPLSKEGEMFAEILTRLRTLEREARTFEPFVDSRGLIDMRRHAPTAGESMIDQDAAIDATTAEFLKMMQMYRGRKL